MAYLAGLGLSVLLVGFGLYRRRRGKLPIDSAYTAKLIWVSLGLGVSLGSLIFPAVWLAVSFSIRGGSVEDNLPPGTDARALLVIVTTGAAMTLVYTFFGYRDQVFPYTLSDRGVTLKTEDRPEPDAD